MWSRGLSYLREGYVKRLVGDNPGDRLVATRDGEGPVIGEILISGGQQLAQP